MANNIKKATIKDLIPDNLNANKGTEFGNGLIEKSIRKFGAGRSILLDKNNRIIAGNKTIENAVNAGLDNVLIVESDGNTIIAVKRTDIDLDSEQGREMAIADNATAKANIEWDAENIETIKQDWNIDTEAWGIDIEFAKVEEEEEQPKSVISTKLIVECDDVSQLSGLFEELQERGFKCLLKE